MKSIEEFSVEYAQDKYLPVQTSQAVKAGANYVLEEIEQELTRRMLEDYNQGAEEDEVAQGCMASMIMFVRNLKEK
jgi:hypothetical protein